MGVKKSSSPIEGDGELDGLVGYMHEKKDLRQHVFPGRRGAQLLLLSGDEGPAVLRLILDAPVPETPQPRGVGVGRRAQAQHHVIDARSD